MSDQTLPDDQRLVHFTDLKGKHREGFYSDDLGLFVETDEASGERTGQSFGPGDVVSWKYRKDKPRDSDIMIIL